MDSEFKSFIKVWLLAIAALTYCHYVTSRIPKGITRFISILPIIFLLTILPLYLHSFYLCAYTAMFVAFMANFNLLLFSFDQGSLSPPPPKLSHFISLACLPIIPVNNKIKKPQEPSSSYQELPLRVKNSKNPPQEQPSRRVKNSIRIVKNSKNPSKEPSLDQEATQEPLVKDNKSKKPPQEPPSRRVKNSKNPSLDQEATQEPLVRDNSSKNPPQEPPSRRVKNSKNPSLDQEAIQEPLVRDNSSKNTPQEPPSRRPKNSKNPSQELLTRVPRAIVWAMKAAFLVLLHHKYYSYKQCLHPYVVCGLLCALIYLQIEIIYALCGFLARALLCIELEPPFNEPYLATSLQDFWGRRWNLVVSGILRLAVYDPIHCVTTRALGAWAGVLARLATFLVSGLLHEVFYYYITRVRPTWEVTCFFVLHGFCAAAEVAVKKEVRGRWRPHRAVSVMLTVAFVAATADWLFLPQLTRNGVVEKIVGEYSIVVSIMCNVMPRLKL